MVRLYEAQSYYTGRITRQTIGCLVKESMDDYQKFHFEPIIAALSL